ncbi:MAG: hypothetical protein JWO00_227 [Candidatus Parcubacteria bacterium]|nr:hypothetical protein [Candidatus Parcubacteria bacterium]
MSYTPNEEKRIDRFFKISVFIKGILSILEIITGAALFFVPVSEVASKLIFIAQGELAEDPTDFIGLHLMQIAHHFSVAGAISLAIYLLSRGIIKLALVVALLKRYLWAYPVSIAIIGLSMVYQIYLVITAHSAVQAVLTAIDIVVLWFIWKEYKILKEHRDSPREENPNAQKTV